MTPQDISASFRQARLDGKALPAYPGGTVPADLESAYAIQDMSIGAWPDRVAGWKVAMIQPAWRETYPAERVIGPVFEKAVWHAAEAEVEIPVIDGGYAAVEAEFALRIGRTIPLEARFADPSELLPYVDGVHAAIELAGSPLASLSALGPGAVASDFGNNSGMVVGPALGMELLADPARGISETFVNGASVGSGGAMRVPGGPLAAVAFLAETLKKRGRTLNAGEWVSSGATTGIHPVKAGDHVLVTFGGQVRITARIIAART
ncbi:2-keto-4-pentenoate hydratase [Noviherbaspirillum aerium]|uniref:2-keto-4-pentenoate hydratase n=1 Tax=Noviherbaspirillum aerium TaxID=2588497 RepID=UPI00124D49F9|nr:fumarylacetoacetate hydrolase family protein [Noviherbaspirillum aerium]